MTPWSVPPCEWESLGPAGLDQGDGVMMATMVNPTTMGMPGMMSPSMGTSMMPTSQPGMVMVPRCKIKMEKCTGGMKITCTCDDKMACSTLQNLCASMTGTMCSVCCMMNGMMVCCCN